MKSLPRSHAGYLNLVLLIILAHAAQVTDRSARMAADDSD